MRKQDKLRPYRVDYFDIEEMKDNDLALVRSAVVRSVTALDAVYEVCEKPEFNTTAYPSLVVIRAYRFYQNLTHKKDVYKAVEDLFTGNKAVEVMEVVEAYRQNKINESFAAMATDPQYQKVSTDLHATLNPTPVLSREDQIVQAFEKYLQDHQDEVRGELVTVGSRWLTWDEIVTEMKDRTSFGLSIIAALEPDVPVASVAPVSVAATDPTGHVTRFSDSSLYDEVCTKCGATDASGALAQPCSATSEADVLLSVQQPAVMTPEQAGTGPDSPATVAVVADLQGMIAHDAHEQAMDTFKPDSVPEGKRFPDPANVPVTAPIPATIPQPVEAPSAVLAAPVPVVDPPAAGRAPTSWTMGMGAPAIETPIEPLTLIEPDQAVGAEARPTYKPQFFSVGDAYRVAGVVIIVMATLLYFILRH